MRFVNLRSIPIVANVALLARCYRAPLLQSNEHEAVCFHRAFTCPILHTSPLLFGSSFCYCATTFLSCWGGRKCARIGV